MDLVDIAVMNMAISARARYRAKQIKSRGRDKTRRSRALAANIRDGLDPPVRHSLSRSRVQFAHPIATYRVLPEIP